MNISASLLPRCNWAKEAQSLSWHIHEDERSSLRFFRLCCSEWQSALYFLNVFTVVCVCFAFVLPVPVWDGFVCQGYCGTVVYLRGNTLAFQPIQTQRWVNKHSGQPGSDDNWPSLAIQCWCASVLVCQGSLYLLVIVQMCALGLEF